jgi:hypothetical protein
MAKKRSLPRHWNAYRPNYTNESPPRPQEGPTTRSPTGFEAQIRAAPSFSRGQDPPLPLANNSYTNPNLIPVTPRRNVSHCSPSPEPDVHDEDGDPDPQLWDTGLDSLMGRTARAYDLVINYERDSSGGERWSRESIAYVHRAGKDLHNDIRLLKSWKHDPSADTQHDLIRIDARNVRMLCEYVQEIISETEIRTWEEWKAARMQEWADRVEVEDVKAEMEYEPRKVRDYGKSGMSNHSRDTNFVTE